MLGTYDPKTVNAVFAGVPILGYADGTFLSAEQNNESFSLTVGAMGDGCRAKSNDKSARFTFTLLQSSITNDLLSAKHNADVLDPLGVVAVGPFMVKDNSGRTVISAAQAWIVKQPAATFGKEVETREWIIETDNAEIFVGGN
ncbi:unnamed protein product [marine sediment metagenome]|uniref:DUF3277 family protein n=1 Tax=marine sediment metagenome TaxID=412755 RepID=X0UWZ9_9ZZZZ